MATDDGVVNPEDYGVVRITPDLPDHADVTFARGYEFTPDGRHIILPIDLEKNRQHELFSIHADGLGPDDNHEYIRLNQEFEVGGKVFVDAIRIAPDGSYVIYAAEIFEEDEDGEEREVPRHLFSVFIEDGRPVEGREIALLTPQLEETGEVMLEGLLITQDSGRIIYRARVDFNGPVRLYSIAPNGEGLVEISPDFDEEGYIAFDGTHVPPPPPPENDEADEEDEEELLPVTHVAARGLYVSPDGQSVTFLANPFSERQRRLFRASVTGGSVREAHPLVEGGFIDSYLFLVSPDGNNLVYRATTDSSNQVGLFTIPINGSDAPRPLHGNLREGFNVLAPGLQFLDENRILFVRQMEGTDRQIWITPLDGSSAPRGLATTSADWRLSLGHIHYAPKDGILYFAEERRLEVRQDEEAQKRQRRGRAEIADERLQRRLLMMDLQAGTPPMVLTKETPRFIGHVPMDGHRATLLLGDFDKVDQIELFHLPAQQGLEPVRLNPQLEEGCRVLSVKLIPDTDIVLFLASLDEDEPERFDLYRADISKFYDEEEPQGAFRVNHPLVEKGQVYEVRISPDNRWIYFTADGEELGMFELFRVGVYDEETDPSQIALKAISSRQE
ncbi:MAG: PD40 domain-containing protein [Candidatus Sumerlaeia bacterium]|nr:PD40 domain-containing protein [Candidatus Sumerlaeia bacterium]